MSTSESNLLKDILSNQNDRLQLLRQFTSKHESSTEFSSIYGVETQKNVIKILVDVIIDSSNQSSISDDQLFETIKTVRILCREPIGQEFYTSDFLESLCKLSRITLIDTNLIPNVSSEAIKCIVNVLLKSDSLFQQFSENHVNDTLAFLKNYYEQVSSKLVEYDEHVLFPLCKLLFIILRPNDTNKELIEKVLELDIVDLMCQWLNFHIDALFFERKLDVIFYQSTEDILKVLISTTINLGPLGSNNKEAMLKAIKDGYGLLCPLLRILHFKLNDDEKKDKAMDTKLFDLKMSTVAGLVNMHPSLTYILKRMNFFKRNEELKAQEPYVPNEKEEEKLLKILVDMFSDLLASLLKGGEREDLKSAVPLIMFLASMAKGVQESRDIFLERFFPGINVLEIEDYEVSMKGPDYKKDSIGSILISYMTSLNDGLKYWSTELLYQLCNEDAQLFVKLTGFGNAAGLLAMRNIFGMGRHLNS